MLVVLSHPVQYFSPLFAELAGREAFDIEVWYGHRGALEGMRDEQFGTEISWGTDLLAGHRHRFFRNWSLRPRLGTHFWGVLNPGMAVALKRYKPDAALIPGWTYATYPLVWLCAVLLRIPVWIRADNPQCQERQKKGVGQACKRRFLRHLAFPTVSRFLAVGKENAAWYESMGVNKARIEQVPHSVDTVHFNLTPAERTALREETRSKLGIPKDACVFLFVGKLIPKKRPLDLLDAASTLPSGHVLFVGEGELRLDLGGVAEVDAPGRIHFAGFVDQHGLRSMYAAADVLVLPSGMGETWGLVVNEALAAGLPVIVSDLCGCAADLVRNGINGFTYPCGDVSALREHMRFFIQESSRRNSFGEASRRVSDEFTLAVSADGIERLAVTRFGAVNP